MRFSKIGQFAKQDAQPRRDVNTMRSTLEAEVAAVHGEIATHHAALINSACRHEGRALLLWSYLRRLESNPAKVETTEPNGKPGPRKANEISLADRLTILRDIGAATDARDRCLEKLDLKHPARSSDPWANLPVLDAPTETTPDPVSARDGAIAEAEQPVSTNPQESQPQ